MKKILYVKRSIIDRWRQQESHRIKDISLKALTFDVNEGLLFHTEDIAVLNVQLQGQNIQVRGGVGPHKDDLGSGDVNAPGIA